VGARVSMLLLEEGCEAERERSRTRAERWKGTPERSVLIFPLSMTEQKMRLSMSAAFKPIPTSGH